MAYKCIVACSNQTQTAFSYIWLDLDTNQYYISSDSPYTHFSKVTSQKLYRQLLIIDALQKDAQKLVYANVLNSEVTYRGERWTFNKHDLV